MTTIQIDPSFHLKLSARKPWFHPWFVLQRAWYRARQFSQTLWQRPSLEQIENARRFLSAAEFALFQKMQPSEQTHSLQVFERLTEQGAHDPDLLTAALLHDAGKSALPLRPWERVWIVLARLIFPRQVKAWGRTPIEKAGWRKALIVAERHAEWGAALASQAGCSALTINLIRRHQQVLHTINNQEDYLLTLLQAADDMC